MEFISSSSQERNIEAMHEMQSELLQKSHHARGTGRRFHDHGRGRTSRASDIHIEPQAADTVVRFRVDGMLRDYQRIPRSCKTRSSPASKFFPTWTSPSAARRKTAASW